MTQSVNLLRTLPQDITRFPAKMILQLSLLLSAVLVVLSACIGVAQYWHYSELTQVKLERHQVAQSFQKVARKYPMLVGSESLAEKVARLNKQISAKRKTWSALTRTVLQHGFSEYLFGLAKVAPQGLWLTNINLSPEDDNVAIAGKTILPIYPANLISAIDKEKLFENKNFELFYLRKNKKHQYLNFEFANHQLVHHQSQLEQEA